MKKLFSLILVISLGLLSVSAATKIAITGNWHATTAASNTAWGGAFTTTADTCIIPAGVTVTIMTANVTCGAFIIELGGTLTYQASSGRNLNVVSGGGHSGTVTIIGRVLNTNSNGQFIAWNGPSFTLNPISLWQWGGTGTGTDGGIHYTGTTATTLFGNNDTCGSLTVTAAGGTVNLSGNVKLKGQGTNYG